MSDMPKVYHPIIDNKPCIMTNTTGMSEAEAAKYCIDKFGKDRFGGFSKIKRILEIGKE